jgi:CRISPR/Cas system-associated exonuclease Cas4 (RecB family)
VTTERLSTTIPWLPVSSGSRFRSAVLNSLSKSKLLAFRQCPKRLWLEVHKPKLAADSAATDANLKTGKTVGEVARSLYDPRGKGVLVEVTTEGIEQALDRSNALLETAQPIFEAGFAADGGVAFADIMLPTKRNGQLEWRIVEVKASTSIKAYHADDAAIQFYISTTAGVRLAGVAIAHVDSSWTYRGDSDYQGLLIEVDVTKDVRERDEEVKGWLREARSVASQKTSPKIPTGAHCSQPFECGFIDYCKSREPKAGISFEVLPGLSKKIREYANKANTIELKDIPDSLLNERQLRVKKHTVSGKTYFDRKGAAAALAKYKLPAVFLDFETISFPVPIWKGTRPYQQIPFQFSAHRLGRDGTLDHRSFLGTDGSDPSKAFAESLLAACEGAGPIFSYNAAFEKARVGELAKRFPRRAKDLQSLADRFVDLLPIARDYYYHPSQEGSWSLKAVLPAVIPGLDHGTLEGIQDGGMAMTAFLEAISASTTRERKAQLEGQLIAYCQLDTYALVRLWQVFSGHSEFTL